MRSHSSLDDVSISDDVVYLENHFNHLCGEPQLAALRCTRFVHILLPHVSDTRLHAVDTMPPILCGLLLGLHGSHLADCTEATVFCQCHWHHIQSSCERPHAVLLYGLLLVRSHL